ncbi:DNA-directed RNA polymerase subunit L [archaeon]|nr:DNA-directed RNA polymerase subunit L [archaeon]
MEVVIVEENKDKFVFDLKGDVSTISSVLKKELWNDSHVKAAGYYVDHPLVNAPRFIVQTDGESPRKVVKAAIKRLEKEAEKLNSEAKNIK